MNIFFTTPYAGKNVIKSSLMQLSMKYKRKTDLSTEPDGAWSSWKRESLTERM